MKLMLLSDGGGLGGSRHSVVRRRGTAVVTFHQNPSHSKIVTLNLFYCLFPYT